MESVNVIASSIPLTTRKERPHHNGACILSVSIFPCAHVHMDGKEKMLSFPTHVHAHKAVPCFKLHFSLSYPLVLLWEPCDGVHPLINSSLG